MTNRKRENRIFFRVSEKELALITERMKLTGIQNREVYLRKMAIDGYILNLDLSGIQKMISLLNNATNNLNQINETRNIYEADIKDLQLNYERLWQTVNDILKNLSKNIILYQIKKEMDFIISFFITLIWYV